ncbi:MAG: hypothetical protein ACFFFH_03775 [Candidatus Thorarchaeota archaeon]
MDDHTYLIDIGMYDTEGIGAAHLLKAGKNCLIDGGTQEGSKSMINTLATLIAFPPDLIILLMWG